MINLADASTTINRPVAEVFNYVCDLTYFADWFPAVSKIEPGNALTPYQPGKIYWETVATGLGRKRRIELRVIDVDYNRRFVTEGQFPALLPRMEITFRSGDNVKTTVVRWRMMSRRTEGLGRLLLLPIARRVMSKRAPIGLKNLKRILEDTAPQL